MKLPNCYSHAKFEKFLPAIFKTRNGESGNGMGNRGMERGMEREKSESLKPGTRKAGIFKTRNEKSRNL